MGIIRRFDRPKEIATDRNRTFVRDLFLKACEEMFIRFKPVGVSQPQANDMVERVNETLTHMALIICKDDGRQWTQHKGKIEYTINTRISCVTGYSHTN